MKLVMFERSQAGSRLGALAGGGEHVVDLAAAAQAAGGGAAQAQAAGALQSIHALLVAGEPGLQAAQEALRFAEARGAADPRWGLPVSAARLRAPIARPGKILALAGNYRAHRAEGGVASPEPERALPEVFCKPATAVIGPGDPIKLPGPPVVAVDYEGELGVVIGRPCSRVPESQAMAYVGGYLCVNDVSGRKLDPGFERSPELLERARFFDWLAGKWFDTFCPIGPWLVTSDEIPDPMALTLVTRVNGEQRQRASTGEMIHSIARTIAWCSTVMTLEPGDVIATGTPAGVGSATGRFLQPGDVVEVEIERIGVLRNPVVAR
jgi:2-keto-4-pentenoate hydratase/2-oxohepta-3-ene-1,7-dioic acid hydratase in catechol pathway